MEKKKETCVLSMASEHDSSDFTAAEKNKEVDLYLIAERKKGSGVVLMYKERLIPKESENIVVVCPEIDVW